ncbi:MAG: AGE family epimerase/isomerase [Prevotellaceae bacterium]|jgi:mannobiose 2-epimerase|nr:AGE family epimerase/isomerase [Prevotellaceae bacterium]
MEFNTNELQKEFRNELINNILPFWTNKMIDNQHGGFFGRIDGNNIVYPQANKGAVLNARILWTFAAAYRTFQNPDYLRIAQRAFDYIQNYFIDRENGGIFWELDCTGKPVNTKKQTYAQGFALYGFSEFYRATGNKESLKLAIEFFDVIEKQKDTIYGGYFEAFTRDWMPIDDMRLSEKDENEKKTMNTHLHVLEPYTNLLRIWKNDALKFAQRDMITLFVEKILDKKTHHLNLFFGEDWELKSRAVSFGHDKEAAWLLFEAAEVLGNEDLLEKVKKLSLKIADAACEGLQVDGSMAYELTDKYLDTEKHWWVQAETVVGLMYAYKNSGENEYFEKALKTWQYIKNQIIDAKNDEWIWSRLPDGSINRKDDKAGFWKCPYHNSRMCLEIIELLNKK